MIRPTPMVDPDLVDLTPQAVVRKPVSYFAKKFTNFVRGQDHFDAFEGGSFLLNDKITFAVIRYSGHPPDTATIYIDSRVKNIETITALVRDIVLEFGLPKDAIEWERIDDPDL